MGNVLFHRYFCYRGCTSPLIQISYGNTSGKAFLSDIRLSSHFSILSFILRSVSLKVDKSSSLSQFSYLIFCHCLNSKSLKKSRLKSWKSKNSLCKVDKQMHLFQRYLTSPEFAIYVENCGLNSSTLLFSILSLIAL